MMQTIQRIMILVALILALTACDLLNQQGGGDSESSGSPFDTIPLTAIPNAAEKGYLADIQEQPTPLPSLEEPYPAEAPPVEKAYPAAEEAQPEQPQGPGKTADLTNRIWKFSDFDGPGAQTLLPTISELNSIEFFGDGRVSIIAGCNVAHGTYAVADGAINIQASNDTQQTCDDASIGNQFLSWLNEAGTIAIEGETMTLELPEGALHLHGTDILTYGDQLTKYLVMAAAVGKTKAQPETMEDLMAASLDTLVYHEGDTIEPAFAKAPGAVVLIQSPNGSMIQADGLANVEENIPISAYDHLEIGSNTKMFTSTLLAQLHEEGVLSVNDPVSKWLPEMAVVIPNGEQITLRQLATHTSGIPDYGDAVIGAGAADSEAMRSAYTPEELVRMAIEDFPPDFAPGEPDRWNYSNTGYILLGMVLEAATGQSYAELLQERIFDPLEMTQTELLSGSPDPGSIVNGYFVFPYDINTTEWNASQGWAAGAIVSTATDMAKFARGLMTGALFQDPATLDLMTDYVSAEVNAEVAGVGGLGYGLGLIEFEPGLFGHRGQTLGFTSIVAMDPQKDFILIALTNSAEGATNDEQPLIGHFLELD